MSSKKVCIWLEPDLYEYLDEARGEELSVPQYIRLILKQKKKSSAKRKPKAITDGSDPFASSVISANMIPGDLKEYADLIVEWWAVRYRKKATCSKKVAERIFDKLRTFTPRDRKKALEGAIAGGWMNIYEIKESKFAKDEKIAPKPKYFKASDNQLPPTLKELGLDKAMNGEK
tara:strand:+ start:304 stop:825 length:522 start_codon:yes stop_codon:yes gene_type:complete